MVLRVKGEALLDILCANSVGIHSMVIMNYLLTCLLSITPAIYAIGNENFIYEFLMLRVCYPNDVIDFNIQYRSNPGQYEYYKNYDDLEVTSTTFNIAPLNCGCICSDSICFCNRFTSAETIFFVKTTPALLRNL